MTTTIDPPSSRNELAPLGGSSSPEDRARRGFPVPRYEPSHYRTRDFLDDQQRLLSVAFPGVSAENDTIEILDGRKLLIQVGRLREACGREQVEASVFPRKYGSEAGEDCRCRFRQVLEFLDRRISEISRAGLADAGDPVAVREELVEFLLDREADPRQPRIPESALRDFLDHWGHRWM